MRDRLVGVIVCCALTAAVGMAQTTPKRPDELLQSGHAGLVESVAFSADGRWTASGGSNHQYSRGDLAFSGDGRLLLQGAQNGVRIWTVSTR